MILCNFWWNMHSFNNVTKYPESNVWWLITSIYSIKIVSSFSGGVWMRWSWSYTEEVTPSFLFLTVFISAKKLPHLTCSVFLGHPHNFSAAYCRLSLWFTVHRLHRIIWKPKLIRSFTDIDLWQIATWPLLLIQKWYAPWHQIHLWSWIMEPIRAVVQIRYSKFLGH